MISHIIAGYDGITGVSSSNLLPGSLLLMATLSGEPWD